MPCQALLPNLTFSNGYFLMLFCLLSTLKCLEMLMEGTIYDTFSVTIIKSIHFHRFALETACECFLNKFTCVSKCSTIENIFEILHFKLHFWSFLRLNAR